jgi:hypothetical protein
MAPAAHELVACGGSAATTRTDRPRSIKASAVVKPVTPAPTTMASTFAKVTPRH